jgi:group I intron endonuclease
MKIISDYEDLLLTGVYCIKNTKNNKVYIGSTTVSFSKRCYNHINALVNNRHKNLHLQRAYNKDSKLFQFEILEVVSDKKQVLKREQYWMNKLNCIDRNIGYNINPIASGTPNMSKETITKRTATQQKNNEVCKAILKDIKENKKTINDVPLKYQKTINGWLNHEPWNKGKKMKDTSHLKVPKRKKADRTKQMESVYNKMPIVYVYDSSMNFIKSFKNAKEIYELSLINQTNLPINPGKLRKGSEYLLNVFNIQKSCNKDIIYKGLYFKTKPLH